MLIFFPVGVYIPFLLIRFSKFLDQSFKTGSLKRGILEETFAARQLCCCPYELYLKWCHIDELVISFVNFILFFSPNMMYRTWN